MAVKKTSIKKNRGRGRPQLYPLTAHQVAMVLRFTKAGLSSAHIQQRMKIHEFAVLRVRRASKRG